MTEPLARALRASVDRVTTGIVITDPEGVPQHWNAFTEELLKRHREFRILDDQIQLADAKEHQQLRWLMRKCAEHGEPQHMISRSKASGDPLFFAVEPLPWDDDGPYACLVLIRSPSATGTLEPKRLAALFGLSQRESELVAALADGRGLDEFALETERSIHTVRTQLKSIYRKTSTQRQSDLVRLVLTSTAFLHHPGKPAAK
jgi:DNA-binding CsgD family transcriptional regulator